MRLFLKQENYYHKNRVVTCESGESCDQEGTMESFGQSGNILGYTDVHLLIIHKPIQL